MAEKLHSGLLTGHPFGGIGVLINKELHVQIRVLDVMYKCRCASIHCVFPNGHSVVLCITYFPCASLAVDYDCELTECLGFIEAVLIWLIMILLLY